MGMLNQPQQQQQQHSRPSSMPAVLLLLLLGLIVSLPGSCAFSVASPGLLAGRWQRNPGAASTSGGPCPCWGAAQIRRRRPLFAQEPSPSSAPAGAGQEIVTPEEASADAEMEELLERTMRTVGLDWGEDGDEGDEADVRLVDTQITAAPAAAATAAEPSPFAAYEAGIEPPSAHTVYYGGTHPRSFWRQGREVVQLVVPVPRDLGKAAVRFRMESKTRLFLAVGDEVVFDRELAQPVYRDTSFWYFEQVGEGLKAVVLELDKRLAYSNWPRLFPEDPDLSLEMQRRAQQQQQQ